ncbi:PAS domain-containing sensor histidine kinase [uncultured Nitratireductor sp.]|uniref:sensor histidine kinase n=1 Tax=uncultured Nitratireductor sp. TaxID=520953 RepID=UPI0025D16BD9|nr:PAS domain-containing sensor histidine kinase [uncultured Nitratireductor sp.]
MSSRVASYQEWPAALSAACERLIHPSVERGAERSRQLRLAGVLFTAPFLFAGAVALLLAGTIGFAQTLALASAGFAVSWLTAAGLLAGGQRVLIETVALGLGVVAVGAIVVISGGTASPMTVMAGALVAESLWVARTRRAAFAGCIAGVSAISLALAAGIPDIGPITTMPLAAHWLIPLIYAATLGLRFGGWRTERHDAGTPLEATGIEGRMKALLLRLNGAGDVVDASHQAESVLNVRSDILLGNGFFERIHVGDRVAYLCAVSQMNEGADGRAISIRLRMPVESDEFRAPGYRQFGIELLKGDDAGQIIAIVRDEGDKAKLEYSLIRARDEARAAKVESKRMLAAVSHELRTPLNAILGFSDTLQTEIFGRFSNDRQREYVRLIHEAGDHLLSVVNSTLEISKLEAGTYTLHPEAFNFAEAVHASVAFAQADATARSIEVDIAVADNVGVVYCDRRAVQQMLINLLSNAVKFSHANGRVRVVATRSGNRLDFSVADDGVGIAADDLERIGEPFAQVRNEETRHVEGTGLGLALVKGLVALQGGGMTIDSAPGEGTRVSISLPVGVGAEKDQEHRDGKPVIDDEWSDEEYRKTA